VLHTGYKDRLRRGLSYPVGLQELDTVLCEIPQAADLHVSFTATPLRTRDTQFNVVVTHDMPHPILAARFERAEKRPSISNSPFADEYLRGRWSITIYPVASARRAQARRLLIAALPDVRDWFCRTRPESWYYGRKVCEVHFDPIAGAVQVNDVVEAT